MLHNDEYALNELLAILKVAPPNEFVCCELGNCFLKKNQYEQAEFWYRKSRAIQVDLRDLHPHFLAYEKFLPCLKLGVLYAKQGDFERAIEYNDCAMQVFPNNIISKCNDMFYRNQLCIAKPTQQNL